MNELLTTIESSLDLPIVLCDIIEQYARYKSITIGEIKQTQSWLSFKLNLCRDDFRKKIHLIQGKQPSIAADEILEYFDQVSQIYFFGWINLPIGTYCSYYVRSSLLVKIQKGIYLYVQHNPAPPFGHIYLHIYASRSLNDLLNEFDTLRTTLAEFDSLSQLLR